MKKMRKNRNIRNIQKSIITPILLAAVMLCSILAAVAPVAVGADISTISFLYEDSFAGVDGDTTGWSTNNNMVDLSTDNWSLLNGTANVAGYRNGGSGILTHRGTRGLGISGAEDDEVDSIGKLERINITFDTPHCLSYLEVRSLFDNEGPGGEPEKGDIDLYLGDSHVQYYHPQGNQSHGIHGVWNISVPDILVDKIVFYVNGTQNYVNYSEFAVAKLDVEPFDININKTVWNPAISGWDTSRAAKVCDNLTFNCTIRPKCCNLTNITVTDILSESLNYTGTENITVGGVPITPVTPTVEPGPDNTTNVTWNFTGLILDKCQTLTIIFNAHKVKCCNNTNTLIVEGIACNKTRAAVESNTVDIICRKRISVDPPETVVQPQAQFDVNITVDPACHCVYGVQYDLRYNTSVVRAESQTKGPFLGSDADTIVVINEIDQANGIVSYAETRKENESGVTEAGTLATIQFTAIGERGDIGELNLSDVIIVDCNETPNLDIIIENGTVTISNNTPPAANGTSKHKHNNAAKKYPCTILLCSCSYDPDYPGKGGNITYIRWDFGDGQYGTTEGLPENNCTCKEHKYESWKWDPIGNPDGDYLPFWVELAVLDDGCPELSNSTSFPVKVYIAGDANADGEVNVIDAAYVGRFWLKKCNESVPPEDLWCDSCNGYLWNGADANKMDRADLNNDCEINILDAALVGANWRHTAW